MNIRYPIYEGVYRILTLNRPVFVKRKHNLLSAGADHIYPIIIVY